VSLGVQVQWLLEMHAKPGQPAQLTPALPWYRVALRHHDSHQECGYFKPLPNKIYQSY